MNIRKKVRSITATRQWKNLTSLPACIVIGALIGALTACTPSATENDKKNTDTQLQKYQANQPIPQADWSQYRQTVIDITQAQIHGMTTTTFQFMPGVPDPVDSCPSVGFPVPSTAQLTNPNQAFSSGATVAQAEPNGTFTGDSEGTYVVCIDPNGKKYVDYFEGVVKTIGGPAHWDKSLKDVVLDGDPTVTANSK